MPQFKVLLLDGIDPAGVDVIRRSKSIEPVVHDKIAREKLLEMIGDADGVIVRSSTSVDRECKQQHGVQHDGQPSPRPSPEGRGRQVERYS